MSESDNEYPSLTKRDDESPAAYQAFMDYIGMGWERSLDALLAQYKDKTKVEQKPPTKHRATLANWSTRHEWQKRLGAWREEVGAQMISRQQEYLSDNIEWQLKMHAQLRQQIESMVARFDELKIARKSRVPDPRNPGQEIEVVYQRVNTVDLERLVKTYSELGEKLRKQLGLPDKVEYKIPGLKTYIGFSPDEWDEQNPEPTDPESE